MPFSNNIAVEAPLPLVERLWRWYLATFAVVGWLCILGGPVLLSGYDETGSEWFLLPVAVVLGLWVVGLMVAVPYVVGAILLAMGRYVWGGVKEGRW